MSKSEGTCGLITTRQLDSVKQTLAFFSMTIAWALMNLVHSVNLGWLYGKADDSGVVIFAQNPQASLTPISNHLNNITIWNITASNKIGLYNL